MKRLIGLLSGVALMALMVGLVPVLSQDMGGSESAEADGGDAEPEAPKAGTLDPNGVLQKMAGNWDLDFTIHMEPGADPLKMKIPFNNYWALDGQFLTSDYDMKEGPFPHKGKEYFSYNEATQEYESIRITSMSGAIVVFHGKYDAKTKTLELKAEYKMAWAGETLDVKGRNVYVFEGDDKYTFTGYSAYPGMEGMEGEMKEVEIIATRSK